jgi:multidrug resistance efflux pump
MSQESAATESPSRPAEVSDVPVAGRGTRIGAAVIAGLIVCSLVLYVVGDRLTPHTSQARVQAFVVPVAAEVSGKVRKVHVRNDEEVEVGQALFDVDPEQYEIAVQRALSDYESVRRSVNASVAGVESARASLAAARENYAMAARDASRQERLHQEDPGAISVRRLEIAQSTREEARSKVSRAEADLRKAEESAGDTGEANAQLRSARSAIEKAELDLARTNVAAPARGVVTDLRADVGNFAQAGAPLMTLIAIHDVWISAEMTENNLGHLDPGDEAAIVLDVLPGRVLKGRVRSVGGGVGTGQSSPPGTLPSIENDRDWLRQAQRIPVMVELDRGDIREVRRVRVGGQADVLVYTGEHPVINLLASFYIRVLSWISYLY